MATYTTIEMVQSLLPEDNQIDDGSSPTKAEVESWLPGLDGELNVAIATGGGAVPVVGADMIKFLNLLEAGEAAYRVLQAKGVTKLKESLFQDYHVTWTNWITKLSDKKTAVTAAGSTAGAPTSVTDIVPRMKKDKVY